jgi:hypothetical protein
LVPQTNALTKLRHSPMPRFGAGSVMLVLAMPQIPGDQNRCTTHSMPWNARHPR